MSDDGPTLVEILGDAVPAGSGSQAHDEIAAWMDRAAKDSGGSRRFDLELRDNLATISAWVREGTGRPVGPEATWLRFVDPTRGAGLVAVVHSPLSLPGGELEADLILVGHAGLLTRGTVRDLCRWAFFGLGLRRVVVRIPVHNAALTDLARRVGFDHDGRARDFFGEGADASVWSMTATRCRWLPKAPAFAPDISPPSSLRAH